MLSNRLALLVDQDVLRRERYQDPGERARHEYRLTEKGASKRDRVGGQLARHTR